jgi:hypothetical protein
MLSVIEKLNTTEMPVKSSYTPLEAMLSVTGKLNTTEMSVKSSHSAENEKHTQSLAKRHIEEKKKFSCWPGLVTGNKISIFLFNVEEWCQACFKCQ